MTLYNASVQQACREALRTYLEKASTNQSTPELRKEAELAATMLSAAINHRDLPCVVFLGSRRRTGFKNITV